MLLNNGIGMSLTLTVVASYAMSVSISDVCPDLKVENSVNLTEYVSKSWYVQQQQVNGYQSKNDLYCVVATYNNSKTHVPFFNNTVIDVYNYANSGGINHNNSNSHNTKLCARLLNSSSPAKLGVAPCFLPNILAGPYWIVALDVNYTWAVITGGQPTVQVSNTTCTTKTSGFNGSGLWIFSRKQIIDPDTLDHIHVVMNNHGIDTSLLLNVTQKGCEYNGAYLK
jgi:lipocalin